MWMGEQITERGIGNGISLVIFAGIVARAPAAAYNTWLTYRAPGLERRADRRSSSSSPSWWW